MIRFVDLRDQIFDVEECPVQFAFYDTIRDKFIDPVGYGPVYTTVAKFESDLKQNVNWRGDLERFRSLMPAWVTDGS